METKKLLTVVEASAMLGLSRTLTYKLISEGSLKSIRIGKSRRVPPQEIDAFIERTILQQCGVSTKNALETV